MKKIIALALALIMALSMASVAFAAYTVPAALTTDFPGINTTDRAAEDVAPGEVITVMENQGDAMKRGVKISYDFTSSKYGFKGASLIESVEWVKNDNYTATNKVYDLVVKVKENLTSTTDKEFAGVVTITSKTKDANGNQAKLSALVAGVVGNEVVYVEGAKKAADADTLLGMAKNHVIYAEDSKGYAEFENGSLYGLVNLVADEKAQVYFANYEKDVAEDTQDAIEAYLGEDFDGIVEYIVFEGTGFKNDVEFQYDAYEEDPHFFYVWDGEKFVDLEAKYDDDEDVDNYVFTADAKGIILVSDVEIVAAAEEETKNPDTGANDVVGVAAALAVVSLVAAGAVSLKK